MGKWAGQKEGKREKKVRQQILVADAALDGSRTPEEALHGFLPQ